MPQNKKSNLFAKSQRLSLVTALLVGVFAGAAGASLLRGSLADSIKAKGNPASQAGSCSLMQNPTGDLVASGSGWGANTTYQYELYSSPQASVGGGQFKADSAGSFTDDLGQTSFFMHVYPNESSLTFDS